MTDTGSMPRLLFWAALLAGGSFLFAVNIESGSTLMLVWKGLGVWLLAVYAALLARNTHGWLLAAIMAFGALGDVLVERSLTTGAAAFAIGHVLAVALYIGNKRSSLSASQRWLAIIMVPLIVLTAWQLTHDPMATLYSLFLACMAASAWVSRFPRYRTGIGAMMFVASDLLIFARLGPLADASWINAAIWLLYFAGQVLIVIGVTKTLANEIPA